MTAAGAPPRPEAFFLGSGLDARFCLFHPPLGACRGAVLYAPPFAEELNRTRRMAALGAQRLAAHGYGVLHIDLYGCGDSAGDFGDARWDLWKDDLATGAAWLQARLGQPVTLWGLRLGALLALDYAAGAAVPLAPLLLWQPVAGGAQYLTQFLRLRTAAALRGDDAASQSGTKALRAALQAGQTLEIAGYDLAPALALALDGLPAPEALTPPSASAHWFEVLGAGTSVGAAATRTQATWQAQGATLHVHTVTGPPFWATSEITTCPALLDATIAALEHAHAV